MWSELRRKPRWWSLQCSLRLTSWWGHQEPLSRSASNFAHSGLSRPLKKDRGSRSNQNCCQGFCFTEKVEKHCDWSSQSAYHGHGWHVLTDDTRPSYTAASVAPPTFSYHTTTSPANSHRARGIYTRQEAVLAVLAGAGHQTVNQR